MVKKKSNKQEKQSFNGRNQISGNANTILLVICIVCIISLIGTIIYFCSKSENKQSGESNNIQLTDESNNNEEVNHTTIDDSIAEQSKNGNNTGNGAYYCNDSSYTLNGSKCEKIEIKEIERQYYCESGWTLSGKECLKDGTGIETVDGTPHYICYSGKLNGTKCEVESYYLAEVKYTCPNGGTLRSTMCYTSQTRRRSMGTIDPSVSESIRSNMYSSMQNTCRGYGGTLEKDGNDYTCVYNEESSYPATRTEDCKNGDRKSGGTCTSVKITNASISYYSCPGGFNSSGSKCTKKTASTETKSALYKDGCPNGFDLSNGRCQKLIEISANK